MLTALQYIRAGTTVEVIVPRQQLRPQCGMPGPYVNQTMSVRRAGQRVYEYVKKAYPETTLDGQITDSAAFGDFERWRSWCSSWFQDQDRHLMAVTA